MGDSKINVKTTLYKVMMKKVVSTQHYVKSKNENEKKIQFSMISKKKMSKLELFLTMLNMNCWRKYKKIIQKYTIDYLHTFAQKIRFQLISMLIFFTFDYQKFQI